MPRLDVSVVHEFDGAAETPDLAHSPHDQAVQAQGVQIPQIPWWMFELGGMTILDRVVLDHVIGQGTFGVVYAATGAKRRHARSQVLAVKVLLVSQLSKVGRKQIDNEIYCHHLVAAHPNIIAIHDYAEDPVCRYIIMDACRDGDLFKCITEDELYVGQDDLIKDIFIQLLDAVEFCHAKGVYHRDLKPENILCRDGGTRILLSDFGLATCDRISRDFLCGSEYYMSPECFGYPGISEYSTPHNDIWALACLFTGVLLAILTLL
ncbi:kinase domain protein [Ceratobasidium sp. AG-Ba]|nr:kinase domain protein [Ceratobasidium sp. AG-Ba]QRW01991.1 kinase domain protein [Ceratobasidium sp. AG-Ba]